MMGRTHATSGMLAGLLLEPVIGLHDLTEIGPFAVTCGDALIESGCPFLFPLSVRDETWYEIRPRDGCGSAPASGWRTGWCSPSCSSAASPQSPASGRISSAWSTAPAPSPEADSERFRSTLLGICVGILRQTL